MIYWFIIWRRVYLCNICWSWKTIKCSKLIISISCCWFSICWSIFTYALCCFIISLITCIWSNVFYLAETRFIVRYYIISLGQVMKVVCNATSIICFFNIFYSCSKLNSGSLIITVTYLFWCVVIVFVKSKLIASYWYGFNFYWSIFFVVVVFFCSIMLDGKSWFRYIVEYFVLEYNQVRCTYYLYQST